LCAQNYTMYQTDTSNTGTTGTAQLTSYSTIVYPNGNLIPSPSYYTSTVNYYPYSGAITTTSSSTYFWQTSFLFGIRGVGGSCLACPGNCSHCQASTATATTCNQCYPGFGLIYNYTTNATTCQKCNTTGCLTCDGLGVCTTCNTTMYVQPNQCQ